MTLGMKIMLMLVMIATLFAIQFGVNHVDAKCMLDKDWPEKPCIDTAPPLPLSKSEWKDLWSKYYTFKGAEWMDQQKSELDQQIMSGNLREWIESGSSTQNFTNYNVWFYYYVNGQVLAPDGYELEEPIRDVEVRSPLQQFKSGISIDKIQCKEELVLVTKHDGSPACVKPETKIKLIERGWAIFGQLEEKEAINLIKKQYSQFQDFPSDGLPPKIIRTEKSDNGWYVTFETQGSGIPIIEAKCFLVDNSKTVIQIGEYKPGMGDMKMDISIKTCS
jgi:hypothetical protein